MNEPQKIFGHLNECLKEDDGFEFYPFKVGSYNESVSTHFVLPYDSDTLAVICLSTPTMFDKSFRRWIIHQKKADESLDELSKRLLHPIQNFMEEKFDQVKEELSEYSPVVIHDFDLLPNRRPKVLMCTCGHIAGAAYYYRPSDFEDDDYCYCSDDIIKCRRPAQKRIGLSLHPKFGGHFAFRAIIIFPLVKLPSTFSEKKPDCTLDEMSARRAVDLFNYHWMDGRFRDCGDPIEKYSNQQLEYFSKAPPERWSVIADWFE